MHASDDSPCHLSAKHCLLRACFPRTAPFRAMLLTARGGPRCLGSKAYEVPVYLIALLHSYFALSRRTACLLSGLCLCTVSQYGGGGAKVSRTGTGPRGAQSRTP